jgi:hypothetical protein
MKHAYERSKTALLTEFYRKTVEMRSLGISRHRCGDYIKMVDYQDVSENGSVSGGLNRQ